MSHRSFRGRNLRLGERLFSATLFGSHQASNLHCLVLSRCCRIRCRARLSLFSPRHTSYYQQMCLYTSSSTRSVPRTNINYVAFFRACSLAVTSNSLPLSDTIAGRISSAITSTMFQLCSQFSSSMSKFTSLPSHVVEVMSMSAMVALHMSETSALNSTLFFFQSSFDVCSSGVQDLPPHLEWFRQNSRL